MIVAAVQWMQGQSLPSSSVKTVASSSLCCSYLVRSSTRQPSSLSTVFTLPIGLCWYIPGTSSTTIPQCTASPPVVQRVSCRLPYTTSRRWCGGGGGCRGWFHRGTRLCACTPLQKKTNKKRVKYLFLFF